MGLRLHCNKERTREMRERYMGDEETKWETANEGENKLGKNLYKPATVPSYI